MLPVLTSQVSFGAASAATPAKHQKLSQRPPANHARSWPQLASPSPSSAMALQNRMRPLKDLILEDRVRISLAHKFMPLKGPKEAGTAASNSCRPPGIVRRFDWRDARKSGLLSGQANVSPNPDTHTADDEVKGNKVALLKHPCPCVHCFKTAFQEDHNGRSSGQRPPGNFPLLPPNPSNMARNPSLVRRRSNVPSTPLFRLGFSTLSLQSLSMPDKYYQALDEDLRMAQKKKEIREKLLERRKKVIVTSAQMLDHQFTGEELEGRWRKREMNDVIGKAVRDLSTEHASRRRECQRIQAYGVKDCMKAANLLGQRVALTRRATAKC